MLYAGLAFVLLAGVSSVPGVSDFLQRYINQILGPVLILCGMLLLEQITLTLPGWQRDDKAAASRFGDSLWASFALGFVFALSFCPVSAGIYFGSLLPLAARAQSSILLPLLYGLGTALPVLLFALLISRGVKSLGKLYGAMAKLDFWGRRVTGAIFILAGLYLSLIYIFELEI